MCCKCRKQDHELLGAKTAIGQIVEEADVLYMYFNHGMIFSSKEESNVAIIKVVGEHQESS